MKTKFHEFQISSVYKGNKCWDDAKIKNYNNHTVTVRNTETGKSTRFEFWESIREVEIKTEEQLLWAFECFLTDALAYIQARNIDDFASEFGYQDSVSKCFKVYKACMKQAMKAKRVVGDEERLCNLVNEINEAA